MKKRKIIKDGRGLLPCKHCLRKGEVVYPQIRRDEDLWYTVCPGCCSYDTYDFLGINKRRTIENWNAAMEG